MVTVKRALVSCFEKVGLAEFARGLTGLGVELIASKGTAEFLKGQRIAVRDVEAFAGATEQLSGRIKTLHPRIFAGILAKRDDSAHREAVGEAGWLDLVVVTLYPFEEVSVRDGVTLQETLESIDIGGVALMRAAAKNFNHVAVVSSPEQYPQVLEALARHGGSLPEPMARRLAAMALEKTSRYDQRISAFLVGGAQARAAPGDEPSGGPLPEQLGIVARKAQALRYGENPHQQAAWYVPAGGPSAPAALRQLHGKPVSYNNLLDLDGAIRCLLDFDGPTCVIVKHASPCAVASASTIAEAYARAYAADSESAFGGIVGFNRPLDEATASRMASVFWEVIVAPVISAEARAVLAQKPSVRLVCVEPGGGAEALEWRHALGGWLVQTPDVSDAASWAGCRIVTTRSPTPEEEADLRFAWRAAKHVRSNAIVLAKDQVTVGIGQGQPSRVRAVRLALELAGASARGAALASDGFFPFPDSIELAAQAGVRAIIQPGGSIKDADVIGAADRAGLSMLVTGRRHFRH